MSTETPPEKDIDPLSVEKDATYEPTNTYALLMPHASLFASDILELLYGFYGRFGTIVHWAPVRGLGRVIIVWNTDVAGRLARQCGAGKLDIGRDEWVFECQADTGLDSESRESKHSLSIRLFPLPKTSASALRNLENRNTPSALHGPDNPDPNRLVPPAHPRNFLVSPPGSPPEGWEPIAEDAPNDQTLAHDLIKALDALQVATTYHRRWIGDDEGHTRSGRPGSEGDLLLQTSSGFIVAVQAPEQEHRDKSDSYEQTEYVATGYVRGEISDVKATVDSMQGHFHRSAGWRTPGLGERTYSGNPAPTARPPLQG